MSLVVGANGAEAREKRHFSIPAGSLAEALIAFARQAEISIALDGPQLEREHTAGISGDFQVAAALRQILRGSGYDAAFVTPSIVKLVRARHSYRPGPARRSPDRRDIAADRDVSADREIIVSASKQHQSLLDDPASVAILDLDRGAAARAGGEGSDLLIRRLPGLASTHLGAGRNKIFIAGIADSSFNGASQSTISQYLGETRLIYSAPDPDLALYDIQRVEVLEGPQGTLYGAGTLGGIIKLVPRPPDARSYAFELSAGTRLGMHAAPGYDAAVVANLPVDATLAARVVGYRTVEGGFIDDTLRGLSRINRDSAAGGRAALRWTPDAAWTVDLGGVVQSRSSRDGQYAQADIGPLARASAIAQPFYNHYQLGSLTITRSSGATQLVSATGFTHHVIDTVYDATTDPGTSPPRAFDEDIAITLFTHETRLSGGIGRHGHWLAGISLVDNRDDVIRSLGRPANPTVLSDVANATLDTAAFAQATVQLTRTLSARLGGRFSYVHQSGESSGSTASAPEPSRDQTRMTPSAAIAWMPRDGMLIYGDYEQGFRPGGLQMTGSGDTATALRFEADAIRTFKLGLRFGMRQGSRLSGGIVASFSEWQNIQADLVGIDGLPFIANIGSGTVHNVSASLTWRPAEALAIEASGFVNSSGLSRPAPLFAKSRDRDLPNTADAGWRIGASRSEGLGPGTLTIDGAIRYVGRSHLAIQAPFDLTQGNYYDVSAGLRLAFDRFGITLDLANGLDSRANTFAFGNPFSVTADLQRTPLRPRSVRIGLDAGF